MNPKQTIKFTENGPDIPEDLLNAHRDGKVIFFCGAGISMRAGLPDFKELVKQIAGEVGEPLNQDETDLLKTSPDKVLGAYASQIQGGMSEIHRHLPSILTVKNPTPEQLETHQNLLTLATPIDPNIGLKLVTTNFDTLFDEAIKKSEFKPAPIIHALPPGQPDWRGIVHLHGRITPDTPLNVVLSETDFGKAYLIDGWATRFINDLFQNYIICFVGYSLNDPFIAYMATAWKTSGITKMYIFVQDSEETTPAIESGPHRIVYDKANNHAALHETLNAWASHYTQSLHQQNQQIERVCRAKPNSNTASFMRWIINKNPSLANTFRDLTPPAPYEWLETLYPTPIPISEISTPIREWLCKHHLNQLDLVKRMIKEGGTVDPFFRCAVETNLSNMKTPPPDGLGDLTPVIWSYILQDRIKKPSSYLHPIYTWKKKVINRGLTTDLRLALIDLLTPVIKINLNAPSLSVTVVPKGVNINMLFTEESPLHLTLKAELPSLFEPFQQLLRDALDIERSLNIPPIYWAKLPSIDDHDQNTNDEWSVWVKLVRESWRTVHEANPIKAKNIATAWQADNHIVFNRLALWAASISETIDCKTWVNFLTQDQGWRLNSRETYNDVCRLLLLRGTDLNLLPRYRSKLIRHLKNNPTFLSKLAVSGYALDDHSRTNLPENYQDIGLNQNNEFNIYCEVTDYKESTQQDLVYAWNIALNAWSDPKNDEFKLTYRHLAPVILKLSDDLFSELLIGISIWQASTANPTESEVDTVFEICERLLESIQGDEPYTMFYDVISTLLLKVHPYLKAKSTQPIYNLISRYYDEPLMIYALAGCAEFFYQDNKTWTETNLLKKFDWKINLTHARFAWDGYLNAQRRISTNFISVIESSFIDTAHHLNKIHNMTTTYCKLLANYVVTKPSLNSLRDVIRQLPDESRHYFLEEIALILQKEGPDYWPTVKKCWHTHWPKRKQFATPLVSNAVCQVIIASDTHCEEAYDTLKNWILPEDGHAIWLINKIQKSKLSTHSPNTCAQLLNKTIVNNQVISGLQDDINKLLGQIEENPLTNPIQTSPIIRRIRELTRLNA